MMKNKNSSLIPLTLTILLVFFTSNYHLLLTTEVQSASIFLIILNLCLIRPVFKYYKENCTKINLEGRFLVLYIIFALLILLSEIYHGNVVEGLFYLYIVPVVYFIGLNKIYSTRQIHYINIAATMPFILVALLFVIKRHSFETNSIALMVLFAGISAICLERYLLRNKGPIAFLIYQIFLGILFLILMGINSRTSMLTFIFAYGINMILNIIWLYKTEHRMRSRYTIFAVLVIVLGLLGTYMILGRLDKVLYKWGGDISSNRFNLWRITMENTTLMGKGYDFYAKTLDPSPDRFGNFLKGPHNIFFGVLGYTGLLSALGFIALNIKYFVDTIKNAKIKDILFGNREVLVFGAAYFISGMLEGFLQLPFYRPANYLWFTFLAAFYSKSMNTAGENTSAAETTEVKQPREFYVFYLVLTAVIALISVMVVPGDGNIFGMTEVLLRYIKK